MTHQEKLTKVTEAIHKACPDLLELKFGCRVIIPVMGAGAPEREPPTVSLCYFNFRNKWRVSNGDLVAISKIIKILGQPIGIAEVLRAIYKLDRDVQAGGILTRSDRIGIESDGRFGGEYDGDMEVNWNLEKDNLNDQSEEVVSLLYSILCHDNNNKT